jgi:hypothetical protein
MSAFGVVSIGFGILLLWSGMRHMKVNEVLMGFLAQPAATTKTPAKARTAAYTTGQNITSTVV